MLNNVIVTVACRRCQIKDFVRDANTLHSHLHSMLMKIHQGLQIHLCSKGVSQIVQTLANTMKRSIAKEQEFVQVR